jgi:hypothetical protein
VYEIRAVSSGVIALELVGGTGSANVSMAGATPEDIVDEIVVVPKPVVSTAWLDFQDAPGISFSSYFQKRNFRYKHVIPMIRFALPQPPSPDQWLTTTMRYMFFAGVYILIDRFSFSLIEYF